MNILTIKNSHKVINKFAGNKGKSLYILSKLAVKVPAWTIIGTDFFDYFLKKHAINKRIEDILEHFAQENAEQISQAIKKIFLELRNDAEIKQITEKALKYLRHTPIAVRSSCIEEDGTDYSFAGQFDTFLNVTGIDDTINSILLCWASAYSERSLIYRWKHKLDITSTKMGVILQQLIPADKSGVAFTINPTNGKKNEMLLSSVYGMGEGLVSGTIDADTIVINKNKSSIKKIVIGEKKQQYVNNHYIATPEELQTSISLTAKEISCIIIACKVIEKHYKIPQDIEWAILGKKVWILQARPVTNLDVFAQESSVQKQNLRIWDNSNIVENFSGITLPLTFYFAKDVYSRTFRQFCKLLPIPAKYFPQIDEFIFSVLGYLNGQIYYNLLNWYKLVGLSPLQKLSQKTMEVQMGVNESLDLEEFEEKITAFKTRSRIELKFIRFNIFLKFVTYFINLKKNLKNFIKTFNTIYTKYDRIILTDLPENEVFTYYNKFINEILEHWGAMIFIESFIGIPYGIIRKLIHKWLPDAPKWLEVSFISGVENLESMKPAEELVKLSQYIKKNKELENFIIDNDEKELYDKLKQSQFTDFFNKLNTYLDNYGYRSNNEMKLEESSYRDDPSLLFILIKGNLTQSVFTSANNDTMGNANEIINEKLNFIQKITFNRTRAMMNIALRARESVRLCRTKAFGITRKMFNEIGKKFVEKKIIETQKDIFYLRIDEIESCLEGMLCHKELKTIIEKRKMNIEGFKKKGELPTRFATKDPIVSYAIEHEVDFDTSDENFNGDITGKKFTGTPCCIGKIEGVASVVSDPGQFKEGILVTYRTDPGWVSIFPSAQAIIIERGSPLTHAAIVARELSIPTIIQIPNITKKIKSGMKLRVDGHSGVVEVLKSE